LAASRGRRPPEGVGKPRSIIRIAISQAAFEAIAATMPLGSVSYEPETNANGERLIWLPCAVVDRLRYLREPGESYNEVILRLAAGGDGISPANETSGRATTSAFPFCV
jgi:hypothetical protein